MTQKESSTDKRRTPFATTELAWLVVAVLLLAMALFYAVVAPFFTMNPAGIPVGLLLALAAGGIVFVVLRSKRR